MLEISGTCIKTKVETKNVGYLTLAVPLALQMLCLETRRKKQLGPEQIVTC